MVDLQVITDPTELQQLTPQWRELLADSESDELVLSPEWLLTWWQVYGDCDSRRLRVLVIRSDGLLVGLAPMVFRTHWYRPGLPFRRLELMGSGERVGEGVVSDYLSVLSRQQHGDVVARTVIDALSAGLLGRWDEFVLPLMDGDKAMPGRLADAATDAGFRAELEEATRATYLRLPDTWAAFLASLPKKGRYLINRSLRDFEDWAHGEWALSAASPDTLTDHQRALRTLHAERWSDVDGGVFRSRRFGAFHDCVMPRLLERGALELLSLNVRGEPIAAMYNMRWADKTYFYQCGRSLAVPPHIRPGGVVLYLAIRRAIESGSREFDFLGGDALYKRQLASTSRPLVNLRIVRPGLREHGRRSIRLARSVLARGHLPHRGDLVARRKGDRRQHGLVARRKDHPSSDA